MRPLPVTFVGDAQGEWRVEFQRRVAGPALGAVAGVRVLEGAEAMHPGEATWTLRGVTGHERYGPAASTTGWPPDSRRWVVLRPPRRR